MRVYDIIKTKREGLKLTAEQIDYFIKSYTNGQIADYQASALIMAMFINGLDTEETIALTQAMMHSGEVVDLSHIKGIPIDKHSTGGVGDTTTLVLAPLVASVGVPIAKMSGRGLGHTGGTIDKLESIPGFHVELTSEQFFAQINQTGVAVIGQSKNIAPADKKIYALRDVTATVDNISLIASSIMSKKLAAGSRGIVLDVKTGSGAFIKELDGSIELAKAMVNIGNGMDRQTVALITDMSQPLGMAIGNSLEVIEAIDTLKGQGPCDLTELCLQLGAHMVMLSKLADDYDSAYQMLKENITNGKALVKFAEFISAQGGNGNIVDDYSLLPQCQHIVDVTAQQDGYIARFDSENLGVAAMQLGAGRASLDSKINLGAGIMLSAKIGDFVKAGQSLAVLYTDDASAIDSAKAQIIKATHLSDQPVDEPKLVQAIVSANGVSKL